MFVANSPLSELVWSLSKGLSLNCADRSLANKNSLFWYSESGNMIMLPSQNIKDKEIENSRTMDGEKSNSIQLTPNPGTCGMMDPVTTNLSVVDVNCNRDDESANNKKDICLESDTQKDPDIFKNLCDNDPIEGQDNDRSANSSSNKLEGPRPDSAPLGHESEDCVGVGSNPFPDGDIQAAGSADIMVSEDTKMKHYDLPNKSTVLGTPDVCAESVPTFEENGGNKVPALEKRESMAENDVQPLNAEGKPCCESPCAKVGMTVALQLQPEGEGLHSPEKNAVLVDTSLNKCDGSLKRKKGKEKVLCDTEASISKEEDDSHESVESSSGRLFSKGRTGNFEHLLVIGSKKLKKHQHESPCSASFLGQDSSFMNWISNMMKGFGKYGSDETPCLALAAKPSFRHHGSHDSRFVPCDTIQEDPSSKSMGFQNIFQALYRPRARIQDKMSCSPEQQAEAGGSKELQVAGRMLCDNDSTHSASDKEKLRLHKFIPVGSSMVPNISCAKITLFEEKPNDSCNVAYGFGTGGVRISDFHAKNGSGSPEDKRVNEDGSVDPSNSSSSVTKKSPLDSLWITRFSPKVSTPMLNTVQCHQDIGGTIVGFAGCNRFFPHSQHAIVSIKDKNNLENDHEPSSDDQMNAIQNCSVSPPVSRVSLISKGQSDQKFKSKLSPILPSQRFKSSEAMASVFARRLDAFRHIIPSKDTENATRASILCFFCGKRGHAFKNCSDIIESELKGLLKTAKLYDGSEEASCLCIRCFQLNHWAVDCPYSPSRKQACREHCASLVGSESCETNPKGQNPFVDSCTYSHGENSRFDTEFMVCTKKISETAILNGGIADLKPVKRGLLGEDCCEGTDWKRISHEFILNEKRAASSSKANISIENQVMPYVNEQIPCIPRETFEIIRRLRLSRADILKWMKSPNSNFCLEGFFLRLRLGKWEEGLGGTGYHVACIRETSPERSSGKCKPPISVDVGGFKCAVDCRYVSNHDFIEDELMAWWCSNAKGAGKLPSVEELNLKLLEKKKFGF